MGTELSDAAKRLYDERYDAACHSAAKRFEPMIDALVARGIARDRLDVWQTGGMCFVLALATKRDAEGCFTHYVAIPDEFAPYHEEVEDDEDEIPREYSFSFCWEPADDSGPDPKDVNVLCRDTKGYADRVVAWLKDNPCDCCGCPHSVCPNRVPS